MGSLIFFVKSLIFTFVIITLMQIRVGHETVEEKTLNWVHSSELTLPLREAAEGGARLIRDLYNRLAGQIDTRFMQAIDSENRPGQRNLGINIERSKEYLKEKAERAAVKIREETHRAAGKIRDELEKEGVLEESPEN